MATVTTALDYDPPMVPSGTLFVAADEPLLVYPSLAAAQLHLEAVDVLNGIYSAAFGPEGQPYRISSEGNQVVIEPTGAPNRPEELRGLLLLYLKATGRYSDTTTSLSDLVQEVWASERAFWQERDPDGERFSRRGSTWGCVGFLALAAGVLHLIFW